MMTMNSARTSSPAPSPQSWGSLALTRLFLDHNELSGSIPAELGQLGALTLLYLNHNELTGPSPAELGQLGALCSLYLEQNQLSGPIPAELGQLGAGGSWLTST
jgi:Leucine-rich repeat (LRR) protein